jgi:hypothetical protein
VTVEEFHRELADVLNDPNIKDKKILHFTNYLVACTDYASFYKVMTRAAKKLRKAEEKASAFSNSRDSKGGGAGSKGGYDSDEDRAESKRSGRNESDSKDYK